MQARLGRLRRTAPALIATILAAAAVVCLGILAFPALASAYHVEAGGRALDAARAGTASEHLERAIAWDQDNAHAYRLLARARELQHDWPAAVDALDAYLALQPANRLGYIELAELYEASRAEVEAGDTSPQRVAAASVGACDGPFGDGQAAFGQDMVALTCGATWAWQQAGYTLADLLDAGSDAQAAGRDQEAFAWYRRAIYADPGMGDGWYYLGLWYEGQAQWTQAEEAYEQALGIGHFTHAAPSDPAFHAGLLLQSRLVPPSADRALALYEAALATDQFSTSALAADCHYRRGEILASQARDVDEYVAEFERAVALNPKHAWAHARLGSAYYGRDHNVSAAESELRIAIELSPESKWMYVMLGDVYLREGRTEQARAQYEQALEVDSNFTEARDRLEVMDSDG